MIVRSAETVEGRARLYRRGRARDRAGAALAEAARARLRAALGVGDHDDEQTLTRMVAERTGRAPGQVNALLHPGTPSGDPALVRLATDLDGLLGEVRTNLATPGGRDTPLPGTPAGKEGSP